MSGDRNLATLIGNGLSIASSEDLLLTKISQEMTGGPTCRQPIHSLR
jgi:hypothetical protein